MINEIIELIDNEVTFSKKDIINIFTKAFNFIAAEKKHNFNLEYHNSNKSHTAFNNGCGCHYCNLRHKLRNTKQYKAKIKSNYSYANYNLEIPDKANYNKKLNELKAQIKEIKKEKYLVKLELNLI